MDFFYLRSWGHINALYSDLKWSHTQSSFVNISDMLSFLATWRIYISLRWAHYLMQLLRRLMCFITFVVSYFDQYTQAWL